jgi:hypothetical protein
MLECGDLLKRNNHEPSSYASGLRKLGKHEWSSC